METAATFFSRQDDNAFTINAEEALVDDAKHYFDRENPSVSKVRLEEKVNIKFDPNDGYMSPVVSSIIGMCKMSSFHP